VSLVSTFVTYQTNASCDLASVAAHGHSTRLNAGVVDKKSLNSKWSLSVLGCAIHDASFVTFGR